ncbi:MAG TPA: alpha/beta hydrolase [Solirubrobacterales bacterium]|nr:alpha/beta hydrolase [Solirubrobacterales bacterium]
MDAQTRAFLDAAASSPAPPPGDVPLEEFRAAVAPFKAMGFEREEVARVEELTVGVGSEGEVPVRFYLPATAEPPPIVVWAHGGSWVRVTVDLFDGHFRVYANRSGCAIAAVDYQLSPESRFPAAIEEVYAVGRWMRDDGAKVGCDPSRVGVAGESSGGNLAAAAVLVDRARGEVGFDHQTLLAPVLDARMDTPSWRTLGERYVLTKEQMDWAIEQYAPGVDRTEPLLSPVCASDLAGLPPTLIVTGELDPLRDEGTRYAEMLHSANVKVDHHRVEGLIHHAIMAPARIDLGRRVVERTAREIGAALAAGPEAHSGAQSAGDSAQPTPLRPLEQAMPLLNGPRIHE